MRPPAQGYFLKEYGSWSVLTIAYLIGVGVSGTLSWALLPLFLALGLLVNSKQALMKWVRNKSDRSSRIIFLGQIVISAIILAAVFRSDIARLLPLLLIPAAYLLLNAFAGEHALLTELMGFVVLSLAAALAKFLLTGGLDIRLLVGVALYFTAGVFKVKSLLLKKTGDRILTVLFVLFSAAVYRRINLPLVILLPLVDNLVAAATLYKVRLRATGWIEVAKGLIFLGLFIRYY